MKTKQFKATLACAAALVVAGNVGLSSCMLLFTDSAYRSPDWAKNTIQKYYYYDIPDEKFEGLTNREIGEQLLDIYSGYYTKEEYRAMISSQAGNNVGMGISLSYIEGSGVLINQVVGNSPAFYAGLRGGETLVKGSKGETSVNFDTYDNFSSFVDGLAINENATFYDALNNTYTVAKNSYIASYMYMYTNDTLWYCYNAGTEKKVNMKIESMPSNKKSFLPEGTAYIEYQSFFGNSPEEMGLLTAKFNELGYDTLIFDLRGNGGGYVDVMCDVAGYMVSNVSGVSSKAMVAIDKYGNESVSSLVMHKGQESLPANTNVYVVADADSASASEALIGVLISSGMLTYDRIYLSDYSQKYLDWYTALVKDSGYAELMQIKNKRTYGKGIMQAMYLNNVTGEALKLTTAKIYWPNGNCIHDVGITVDDGCKTAPAEWNVTLNDEQLQYIVNDIVATSQKKA